MLSNNFLQITTRQLLLKCCNFNTNKVNRRGPQSALWSCCFLKNKMKKKRKINKVYCLGSVSNASWLTADCSQSFLKTFKSARPHAARCSLPWTMKSSWHWCKNLLKCVLNYCSPAKTKRPDSQIVSWNPFRSISTVYFSDLLWVTKFFSKPIFLK